ncbi:MAG: hypothetical protein R3E39_14000 [Anaerolineae bacterium]
MTYARNMYIRDMMVANGDANKSIWISEAAWNAQPEDPDIVTSQYGNFGIVTEEQAARYMPLAYQRAQEEWPWVGNISYWFFKRPADYEKNQAFYYFRMVEPDFTPLPVYDSMKQYITRKTPTLYAGVHQAESWAVKARSAKLESWDAMELGQYVETQQLAFTAYGTDVIVKMGDTDLPPTVTINGNVASTVLSDAVPAAQANWYRVRLATSLVPQIVTVSIEGFQGEAFGVDSIAVLDRTMQNILPLIAGLIIGVGMTLFVVVSAWRERRKRV